MVSGVASNLPCAPSFTDYQLCCLHTKAGNILIGGVWHTHSVKPMGDAKLLNHYGRFDFNDFPCYAVAQLLPT